MSNYYVFLFVLFLSPISFVSSACTSVYSKSRQTRNFICTEINLLQKSLERALANTTAIKIYDSNILNVPGQSFIKFSETLRSLDLHSCGIQTFDKEALIGLTKLEKLILYGNKLTWVSRFLFINTYELRVLDISFNAIQGIDFPVYQMLPFMEEFYFDDNQLTTIDFNMFSYMGKLRRVKFGKNPWNWVYRARLTWQMENQNVSYDDDWEDWHWMSKTIKECVESGQGEIPNDNVIDCAIGKLLNFASKTFSSDKNECFTQARDLVRCVRLPATNGTVNTDNQSVRMILQNYEKILPPMSYVEIPFKILATSSAG
ncbi:leucine-rich repeat and fibronectin type-III domain-containing protein 5-like [Prorops nasuta]|uniref:leucine-rich repeat and fibronectin type-III domain-containing protein 5-like n=1 Tax=Prorops nasuta TaxID=863751 RepID=UPI0034CE2C10